MKPSRDDVFNTFLEYFLLEESPYDSTQMCYAKIIRNKILAYNSIPHLSNEQLSAFGQGFAGATISNDPELLVAICNCINEIYATKFHFF